MLYNRNYHLGSILWTCPAVTRRKEFNAKFYLSSYLYEYKLDYSYVYFIYLTVPFVIGKQTRGKVFCLVNIFYSNYVNIREQRSPRVSLDKRRLYVFYIVSILKRMRRSIFVFIYTHYEFVVNATRCWKR